MTDTLQNGIGAAALCGPRHIAVPTNSFVRDWREPTKGRYSVAALNDIELSARSWLLLNLPIPELQAEKRKTR